MRFVTSAVVAAILAAAAPIAVCPVAATDKPVTYKLAPEERAALAPIQMAIDAKDWAAARAALPPALVAAKSPDARYVLGQFELQIGIGTNDIPMQATAVDTLIASGFPPAADLPALYHNQGALALKTGNKTKAADAYAHLVALNPRDPEPLVNLAQIKNDLGSRKEAVQLISRAIDLKKASGQKADETWYKYALKLAYDGRNDPALRQYLVPLSRQLVAAYPTTQNWRDALLVFRDAQTLDPATALDVLRLMRASDALAGERDWYDLADGLYKEGNIGEAKAVLDDGIARRAIDPQKAAFAELIKLVAAQSAGDRASLAAEEQAAMAAGGEPALKLADAYAGYGEGAKAVALYRAALGKGRVDTNLVKTRLAMALLASGDPAAARATFKSLTGVRADLGAFWLAWLDRPAS
jgi:tetratricopeptide (TPR) repeat protein